MIASRFTLFVCLLGLAPGVAWAAPGADAQPDDAARIRLAVAHGQVMALPRILVLAQQRVPGEVLKVELEEIGDRLGYDVKTLTADGRICEIKLDARTGAILTVQAD